MTRYKNDQLFIKWHWAITVLVAARELVRDLVLKRGADYSTVGKLQILRHTVLARCRRWRCDRGGIIISYDDVCRVLLPLTERLIFVTHDLWTNVSLSNRHEGESLTVISVETKPVISLIASWIIGASLSCRSRHLSGNYQRLPYTLEHRSNIWDYDEISISSWIREMFWTK